LAFVLVSACSDNVVPYRFEGVVIDSAAKIRAPLSGKEVCAAGVDEYSSRGGRSSSHSRAELQFAPEAFVVVNGARLSIVGERGGQVMPAERGPTWWWHRNAREQQALPPGVEGFISKSAMDCTRGEYCVEQRIELTERYVPCGAEISIRGFVTEGGFVLLDPSDENQRVARDTVSGMSTFMLYFFGVAMLGTMFLSWIGIWLWSRT
jgi:hypothetical protein